ncbi:hypothetical protein E4T66_17375 [Sinimarinibacterium sp. CAU 1509]|uniref:hypothetical protein n=1 Tax=Sinimarinibacterium sp. CAU 1509 TaxID=2562283 RepID=UPI0010ACCB68|nr:hypothetical protein [Sinimarinibacterium sp. CAU 1509]TJY57182.1 hypothetical protein E4T66_17375 [Sinimarinibacterium sp. CAU 1509]
MTLRTLRSNVFSVADREAFMSALSALPSVQAEWVDDNRVCLFDGPDAAVWPELGATADSPALVDLVAPHLPEGEVAIFTTAEIDGPLKRPTYVGGTACAINREGSLRLLDTAQINAAAVGLTDRYQSVEQPWGSPLHLQPGVTSVHWQRAGDGSVRVVFSCETSDPLRLLVDALFEAGASLQLEPLPEDEWSLTIKHEGDLLQRVLRTLGAPASLPERQAFSRRAH